MKALDWQASQESSVRRLAFRAGVLIAFFRGGGDAVGKDLLGFAGADSRASSWPYIR